MHKKIVAIMLLILTLSLSVADCVFAQDDGFFSNIQGANVAFEQAFNAVLDAENAGANVASLLDQLNDAAALLAQAQNSYTIGDNNAAAQSINQAIQIIHSVQTAAENENSTAANQNSILLTIGIVFVGLVFFVLALLFVWRRFKRHYIADLSQAKPEVVSY